MTCGIEWATMATNMKAPKQRFKIIKFINPRTDTTSWRVSGIKRNGERIRENYADPQEAQFRYTELEGGIPCHQWHRRVASDPADG